MKKFRCTFALMLLIALAGCRKDQAQQPGPQPQSLPTAKFNVGNKTLTLELAEDNDSRETGLMYRDSMPDDHGMIFVFPDEDYRNFWMKNTRIPLDIAYLDHDGRVVSIHSMKALDLTSIPSGRPAKFAIEMNLGAADKIGLKVGDQITIPAEITAAAR